jgi:lysophospholipase L1-like esterase
MPMAGKIKKALIVSIIFNVLFALIGAIFVYKGSYRKIIWPYLRDYYRHRVSLFEVLRYDGARIFFVGDSLTDYCEWGELFGRCDIASRGVSADTTDGVLNRIGEVTARKPAKIFIMIGGNDFVIGRSVDTIEDNYRKIIRRIRAESPGTLIYIQSNLPTVHRLLPLPREYIVGLNRRLKSIADNRNIFFLDIYSRVVDKNGDLDAAYTIDGAHLNGRGYLIWRDAIREYVK